MIIDIVKVILPAILAFWIGIAITPFLTNFLYTHKMWKKKAGKKDSNGIATKIFNQLHMTREVGTPRLGGIVIWAAAAVTILGIWLLAVLIPNETTTKLNFLSQNQTWIPLATLLIGAVVGLVDDLFEITGYISRASGGLSLKVRLAIVTTVGVLCGLWFFVKLDVVAIGLPFLEEGLYVGWLIVPLFAVVLVAIYSGGVIDGIDGLAGGVFAAMFAAYTGIAFYQQQINLAAFSAMMVGAILAFLWFNIPPARFYMSETGSMALTITLGVVAFTTDSLGGGYGLLVLPIIAFPLVMTVLSNIIQVTSKRLRGGKKVFLVAPIHHHFEAIGWPAYKVTMRYWILSIVTALLGMILALIG
ncbi:MAG: hypothetical protein WD049_04630 [Candidatus Paceibacterota bacterium]